jgi:voltage-gated potassium channel Kch
VKQPSLHRLLANPRLGLVGVVVGMALFETLHHFFKLPEAVSAVILSLLFLPILVSGIVTTISMVLADPEGLGHVLRYTFAFLVLTIVFFAMLYAELGVVEAEGGAVTHDFLMGLYFSVSTFATLGYGDFVPTPEARVVASVEALSGYVLLGLIVASAFALLSHRSSRRRG